MCIEYHYAKKMYVYIEEKNEDRALASLAQWIEHRSWVQFHSRATNRCNASLAISPCPFHSLSKKSVEKYPINKIWEKIFK